jgi:hypothetical protein
MTQEKKNTLTCLTRTVFELNMLALTLDIPFEVELVPHKKGYSNEWLKEN